MRHFLLLLVAALASTALVSTALVTTAFASPDGSHWRLGDSGTTERLRGLSAVSHRVAWASGSGGTVLRTTDAGGRWTDVSPPGTGNLDFRDVEAFDARHAVALSIGTGTDSRIYRTADGGKHWRQSFRNTDPNAFYDCIAFFSPLRGLAMGDPVDGRFRILTTVDGGRHWNLLPRWLRPRALADEAGFAASGQCLSARWPGSAWISTGGGTRARVLRSNTAGLTWSAADTPLASSPSSGVFATAFRDRSYGLAVGGDFAAPERAPQAAFTTDGGRHWRPTTESLPGYRSGAAWRDRHTVLAVGPTGSDISRDAGQHWARLGTGSFDTVDCTRGGACWAAGEQGRVAVLS